MTVSGSSFVASLPHYPSSSLSFSLRSILILASIILYILHNTFPEISIPGSSSPTPSSRPSETYTSTANGRPAVDSSRPRKTPTRFGEPIRSSHAAYSSSFYDRQQQQQQQQQRHSHRTRHRSPLDQLYADFNDFTAASEHQSQRNTAFSDSGSTCAGYYCIETQTCVSEPIHCPCPSVIDTKCWRGDWQRALEYAVLGAHE
ncbi:hypothetical protein BC939DRAFT_504756 [Gamsiella multidivaricata]|uniref:uncharacterized protein n=1 Tax=Gamsiella multidivaricata TaxID=101098 RepID=UPI00221F399C|nr:uncharacterized protein BC939DRAFT_504756 [Gamsiella multidivaricata]KAI7820782.1 hypothetical protein BC939DRAFT_504756 [Gamsiella multidivaricata]